MKINNLFINLLHTFGDASEIYNAMDTEDIIEIIAAADRAITKLNCIKDISIFNKKSLEKSKELRELGNSLYSSGKNREALVAYNMAITYAFPSTQEMLLAVGNRSAVLFNMKSLSCVSDIKICLTMGSPPELALKLNKRMLDAQAFVKEQVIRDVTSCNPFIITFFTQGFINHKDINSASSDVGFVTKNGVRQITARRKISPGKIVAIEPAFVSCDSNGYSFLTCYYCNKFIMNPSPCAKCCYAMFCTEECQILCMKEYHSIECQIIDLLEKIYSDPKNKLTIRAAIKLSLKLGWDGFIAASENIGSSRMKVTSTKEMYSVDEPLSMLSYDDNQELVEGRMFNASIICAIALKILDEVPNYFPKESAKRSAAKKAMSKIMFHLYVYCTNTVCFTNSAYDYKSNSYKFAMHTCLGWFSMCSKMTHSCQPNLLIVGMNDHIALLSLRTIEKGEELTISFFDHFLDYDLSRTRMTTFRAPHLFLRTKKMCSCIVCTEEWSFSDVKYEPMTDRQADLYRRYQPVKEMCFDRNGFQLVCDVLDNFSLKSQQYHDAFRTLNRFLSLCQCKVTNNACYFE